MKKIDIKNLPEWCANWPFWDSITHYSNRYNLNPYHIAAIIKIESNGNPFCIRYEKDFRWIYPEEEIDYMSKDLNVTNYYLKDSMKTSWGLMQIMGATAYDMGLNDEIETFDRLPASLLDYKKGIKYGTKYLNFLYQKYGPNTDEYIAAYNAGSVRYARDGKGFVNQSYVDKFFKYFRDIDKSVRY